MIFISAGFDAHRDDEMAMLRLVEADYAWVTQQLMASPPNMRKAASCLCSKAATTCTRSTSVAAHLKVLGEF